MKRLKALIRRLIRFFQESIQGIFLINEADLHITSKCTSRCSWCYYDPHGELSDPTVFHQFPHCEQTEGDTKTLKDIISRLRRFAGVRDLVLVGGDPCEHNNLVSLLRHAKEEGLNTVVLSNTHRYRESGKEVPIEEAARWIDEVDFTLHGYDAASHDAVNNCPGSYESAMEQIKKFMRVRGKHQSVGIVLNMVPTTMKTPGLLFTIMVNAINELKLSPKQDFFTIQRLGPSGKALSEWSKWKIGREMLTRVFDVFDKIKEDYGIETKVCIDTFPWCALPKRHWHYLKPLKGGCNWGRRGGVLSVLMDGTLQRCALCKNDLAINIRNLKSKSAFSATMKNHPTLIAVREGQHLDEVCKRCKLLKKCGGGCIIANTDGVTVGDPYDGGHFQEPRRGMDYLANPNGI